MKHLILALATVFFCQSYTAQADSLNMGKFRNGDINEVSAFFQSPAILVCEYKIECERCRGAEWKPVTIHYCRVVSSNIPEFPVNSVVVYRVLHERDAYFSTASGQLFYIFTPSVRQVSTLNGDIELYEYCCPLPIYASYKQIDSVKRRLKARQHN